jgi:FkbM family methyltransferase
MQIEAINSKNGKTYWVEQGDSILRERLKHGQYQSTNWDFVQKVLTSWRTALDLGSNNGLNAVHYSEKFDRVECFEPTPTTQTLWRNTVRDNQANNCMLHTQALGDAPGTAEMMLVPQCNGHNFLDHSQHNPKAKESKKERATVEVRTLDSYNFQQVDFIKIDVEGYEQFVLNGGEQTLMRERPLVQIEVNPQFSQKFGYTAQSMLEWMRTRNFRVCSKNLGWLDGEFTNKTRTLMHNGVAIRREIDLFFVPVEWNLNLYNNRYDTLFEEV